MEATFLCDEQGCCQDFPLRGRSSLQRTTLLIYRGLCLVIIGHRLNFLLPMKGDERFPMGAVAPLPPSGTILGDEACCKAIICVTMQSIGACCIDAMMHHLMLSKCD